MSLRKRSTVGIVEPCLPSPAKRPPAGTDWIHEFKHDGFRILARRDSAGVRLLTRNGHDLFGHNAFAAEPAGVLKHDLGLGSLYRSGRADCWVKVKNPKAPAVKREAEEDWGR